MYLIKIYVTEDISGLVRTDLVIKITCCIAICYVIILLKS